MSIVSIDFHFAYSSSQWIFLLRLGGVGGGERIGVSCSWNTVVIIIMHCYAYMPILYYIIQINIISISYRIISLWVNVIHTHIPHTVPYSPEMPKPKSYPSYNGRRAIILYFIETDCVCLCQWFMCNMCVCVGVCLPQLDVSMVERGRFVGISCVNFDAFDGVNKW